MMNSSTRRPNPANAIRDTSDNTYQSSSLARTQPIEGNPLSRIGLTATILAVSILVTYAGHAQAGLGNTPLPTFSDGKPSVLIMNVPGVVKRNNLQTVFLCTSLDSNPIDIGVEIFAPNGALLNDINSIIPSNNKYNGSILNVQPAQTVTFGTSGTATYIESLVITFPPLTNVAQGSARIVASSSQVRCNVMLLDKVVTPPVALATLGEGTQPTPGGLPAGIPLPQFSDGQTATYSALFPGMVKRFSMETAFFCTSLAPGNIDIGIEVLTQNGMVANSIAADNGAALNVAPGQTVTFATTATAALLENVLISGLPPIDQGLARVVSNSGQLTCAAVVIDGDLAPPTAISGLAARGTGGGPSLTVNSPLPPFSDGKPSVHIMTVPSILKRGQLQTVFMCTSVDPNPVDIGVEIFGLDGTLLNNVTADVGAVLGVGSGQTITLGTSTTATYTESGVIPLVTGLQGIARVVASSNQVRCNAMVVDDLVTPPVTLALLGDAVQPAVGGLPASSPLPLFSNGRQATHAAYFPGVVKRVDAETDIFCTSLAAGNIDIGVQIFKPGGAWSIGSPPNTKWELLDVAPGATVTFGTTGTAALFESTVITQLSGITQGMARVVSDSDQLLCSAVVLDAGLSPPTAMSALVGYGAGNAVCGDGAVQPGEQCDGADDAACPGQCQSGCLCPPVCGDGFVQPGEQCDDGGTSNGDCCSSSCQFEAAGSSCNDGNVCNGFETCNGAGICASGAGINCDDGDACTQDSCEPLTGSCLNEAKPATTCLDGMRATLQIKDHPTKPVDQIKWKYSRGGGFGHGALGNPSSTATYTLCLYDKSGGVPSLATSLTVAPNANWQDRNPKGWKYKDKLGAFDGVQQLQLRPGTAGKTKVQVKAKGGNLPTPVPFSASRFFDQNPDVTVQLFNSDTSTCWTSTFPTSTKNKVSQFKAKAFQ